MKNLTSSVYEEELAELGRRILKMGERCEQLIEMARKAMGERDADLAAEAEAADQEIDEAELAIDELAFHILALRQPAARDLRFLIVVLKVVKDLERIGDEASNMAARAGQLTRLGFPVSSLQPRIQEMARITNEVVHEALQAFVHGDEALARAVLERDDEVDELYGEIRRQAQAFIGEHPKQAALGVCLASTCKYLERIADHATNIAEMVIFMTSGQDVRHNFGG